MAHTEPTGSEVLDDVDIEVTFAECEDEPTERMSRPPEPPMPRRHAPGPPAPPAPPEPREPISSSTTSAASLPALVPAMRVAILPRARPAGKEQSVAGGGRAATHAELVFIGEDEDIPDDIATAVLLPDSSRDSALIVRMFQQR